VNRALDEHSGSALEVSAEMTLKRGGLEKVNRVGYDSTECGPE